VGVSGVGPPALGRDVRIAQIMIERGLVPDPAALADPATRAEGAAAMTCPSIAPYCRFRPDEGKR
jgi:hypothetical protein